MPQDNDYHAFNGSAYPEEAQSLLSADASARDPDVSSPPSPPPKGPPPPPPKDSSLPRRQSSLSHQPQNGAPRTPRTANRVRFDIEERRSAEMATNAQPIRGWGRETQGDWAEVEEEEYMLNGNIGRSFGGRRASTGQRAPLLTDIEAPSVTVASTEGGTFRVEDLLEGPRPKSGMRSAFMNMANSIIGAGIIGQPYAFRQAGLVTGVILLVALTITVSLLERWQTLQSRWS